MKTHFSFAIVQILMKANLKVVLVHGNISFAIVQILMKANPPSLRASQWSSFAIVQILMKANRIGAYVTPRKALP